MKFRKICVLVICVLCLLSAYLMHYQKNNTFKENGILFAVTLDGKTLDHLPERGKYDVKISCKNGTGKWLTEEWKFVIEDITGNVSCNLDFSSIPESLTSVVEKKSTSTDYGYRYTGVNPNNYIWFNNEMWRIIGETPIETEESSSENLVKIIRASSIGSFHAFYNSITGSSATWENSNVYNLLNDYYYEKNDGSDSGYCYSWSTPSYYKQNCDYKTIGIGSDSFYGKMVKPVYWNVGVLSSIYNNPSQFYEKEITSKTSTASYIGIINPSDYGFSADAAYHGNSMETYSFSAAASTDWMYKYVGNCMSIINSYSGGSGISYTGGIEYLVNDAAICSVIPVVYLDSSVYVVSGTGTEANPYQIAM